MDLVNLDSEIAIIGGIFVNPASLHHAKKELEPADFYLEKHQVIFKTFLEIADRGEPIDILVLFNALNGNGGLKKAGGKEYLMSLADATSTSAGVAYHTKAVKDVAAIRNLHVFLLKEQDKLKKKSASFDDVAVSIENEIENLRKKYSPNESRFTEAGDLLNVNFDKQAQVIGQGILPEGGNLLIAGESGIGKSIIRTEIAIHLVMGWDLYDLAVSTSRKVLIVQFENPESTEQYRLKKMLEGFNIERFPNKLMFVDPTIRFDLSLKKDRPKALDLVKSSGCDVVIWDPLTSLHSENENDNVKIRAILDTLTEINRKANTTGILLHHFGKPQEGQEIQHRTRGASSIRDWCDTLIAMTVKPSNKKILRYLTFVKVRNGPDHKPILLERDKKTFTHSITEEEILGNPTKVSGVLASIGGEVGSQVELIKALVKELPCSEKSAKKYIANAVNKTIQEFELDGKRKGYTLIEN